MKTIFTLIILLSIVVAGFAMDTANKHEMHATTDKDTNKTLDSALNQRMPATVEADLQIQKADISENAVYYPITIDGVAMEVIAVRVQDGTVRTAMNTCQVCFSSGKGYFVQEQTVLVCQNCKKRFRMSQVGVASGGCNPLPISSEDRTETENTITISKNYIGQYKEMFANWK